MNPFGKCRQELAHVRLHGPGSPDARRRRNIGEVEAVEGYPPVEWVRGAGEGDCRVAGTIRGAQSALQAGAIGPLDHTPGRVGIGRATPRPGSGAAQLPRACFPRISRSTTRGLVSP